MDEINAERISRMRRASAEGAEGEEASAGKEALYEIERAGKKGWMIVKYEKLELEEREILNGRAVMLLPASFQEMPEEWQAIKYPAPDRPRWILCDEAGEVTFTMQIEEGRLKEGELEQIAGVIEAQMRRMHPDSLFEERETIGEGGNRICWFSLDLPLADDACGHAMFFREIDGGLLMGTFDCSSEEKTEWRAMVRRLLGTIKETGEEAAADEEGRGVKNI